MSFLRLPRLAAVLAVTAAIMAGATPGSAMIEPGFPGGDAGAIQTGVVAVEQADPTTWYTVNFDEPFDSPPAVVMGPVDQNGGQTAMMRVRGVTTTGFEYQVEEWEYLDGYHLPIEAAWLAATDGWHDFVGMTMFVTSVPLDHGWQTVELGFDEAPVVFAQVVTENDATAASVRVRNVSGASAQLRLQEEEAADGVHGVEIVQVIAITEGSTTMDNVGLLVGRTADAVTHSWFSVDAASRGVTGLLATGQTYDGPDTMVLRYRSLSDTGFQIRIHEEQSRDGETSHTTEVVGWMMITAW